MPTTAKTHALFFFLFYKHALLDVVQLMKMLQPYSWSVLQSLRAFFFPHSDICINCEVLD